MNGIMFIRSNSYKYYLALQKYIKKEDEMFKTLSYIGEKLNDSNILWAVGASMMLNQFGLINNPNDIDIFVDIKDINRADEILQSIGEKKKIEKNSVYSTEFFYKYLINGIGIDVMAGFAINHSRGVYEFIFDTKSISKIETINEIDIPFTSLEDWYIIYQLIPNREFKVNLIEKYLTLNGIENPDLFKRALRGNLPLEIRSKIENVLSSHF